MSQLGQNRLSSHVLGELASLSRDDRLALFGVLPALDDLCVRSNLRRSAVGNAEEVRDDVRGFHQPRQRSALVFGRVHGSQEGLAVNEDGRLRRSSRPIWPSCSTELAYHTRVSSFRLAIPASHTSHRRCEYTGDHGGGCQPFIEIA
jgi:hypothetical protein